MIIILNGGDRSANKDLFDQHFRFHDEAFVSVCCWSLPVASGIGLDPYDDDDAVYIFDLNEERRIQSSIRITPTIKSSLIADYFPHLIENGESPRSPTIYECNRYISLSSCKTRSDTRLAKSRIIGAMLEWCLARRLSFL